MRFVSKLTMTVAAIFFALSVSAHAGFMMDSYYWEKSVQVCEKWEYDAGWLDDNGPIFCSDVLSYYAEQSYAVNSWARKKAKACLRADEGCPTLECLTAGVGCP